MRALACGLYVDMWRSVNDPPAAAKWGGTYTRNLASGPMSTNLLRKSVTRVTDDRGNDERDLLRVVPGNAQSVTTASGNLPKSTKRGPRPRRPTCRREVYRRWRQFS